ncbi:NAD(P)-binding protein [Trichoderma citrinoviride]|uniref:NAD(P)-binding protein n=1 Tax=Trichoderma citrinoviride TaxID=58853 RepID=A0A2T4BBC3_9HYPO|nr:NAD(P)-binding protein [Trichoderma citrinoviride]PTB66633.1 NAD(P)-binding protein [Trichoderma citrinoviride]
MWNNTSIPDLTGKVALVTGGNVGIGFQIVKQLALHGAKVYLGARSEPRAKQAIDSILSEYQSITKDRVIWLPLDLSRPANIMEAAQLMSSWEKRLDILINNAGIATDDFTTTAEGFESTIAVNHIGHFILTTKLLPLLKATASAIGSDVRIVTSSSVAEKFAPKHNNFTTTEDLSDPGTTDSNDYTSRKTVFSRYGASKLANLLFTRELQRRLDEEDVKITALAVDPGPVATDGGMSVFPGFLKPVLKMVMKSPEKGALTQLFCATAKEIVNEPEKYKGKLLTAPGKTNPGSDKSRNSELARSLWRITEEALKTVGA